MVFIQWLIGQIKLYEKSTKKKKKNQSKNKNKKQKRTRILVKKSKKLDSQKFIFQMTSSMNVSW